MTLRVAILGAGPSGLSQLRAFEAAHRDGTEIPEIVCYEKQNDLGGIGTTHGGQAWMLMVSQYTAACTATFGQTAQKNV